MSAAIVTGAGGAIGSAIARRLTDDGWQVVCVDRSDAVEELARALREQGREATGCIVDLTGGDAPKRILAGAEALATPRLLVNNAGITRDARALEMTEDEFRAVVRVNAVAPLRLAEELAPHLGDDGAVVNIASRAALGNFGQANYVAAKAALVGATRAMAMRWAPRTRVNAVAPGLVDTPMSQAMPADVLEKLVARIPAGRIGEPREIADVVAFLASERASYVTGQLLLACGGRSIAG